MAVFAIGLIAIALVWQELDRRYLENLQGKFLSESQRVTTKIDERLSAYAQILRSGSGFFAGSASVGRDEWHDFAEKLRLDIGYRGIQGVGFSLLIPKHKLDEHIRQIRNQGFPDYIVKPAGNRELYTSIIYLEPFSGRNLRAFGYDMFSEPVRNEAMSRARDIGDVTFSGKVKLVQETTSDVQAGILAYVPVFKNGALAQTVEQRRDALVGWVYSPYRMKDLMTPILDNELTSIRLEIFDGESVLEDTLLFDNQPHGLPPDKANREATLTSMQTLDVGGRQWTLRYTTLPGFAAASQFAPPWSELAGMSIICALLVGLTWSLLNTRLRAEEIAVRLTDSIKRSEARYNALFAESKVPMLLVDPADGRILEVNRRASDFYGYAKTEFCGMNVGDIAAPTRQIGNIENVVAELAQGSPYFLKHRLASGACIDVEVYSSPIEVAEQQFLVFIIHDISERKRAERELDLLMREKTAMLGTDLVGFAKIKDQTITWANPHFEKMLGYRNGESVGTPIRRNFASEKSWAAAFGSASADIMNTGGTYRTQIEFVCRNGEILWADLGSVLLDASKNEILWACLDITEIQKAREKLQASHDLLNKLSRQVPGVLFQFQLFPDGRSRFPYASDGIQEIYGVTPEQVRDDASPVFAVLHPDDHDRIVSSIHESARALQPWQLEYRADIPGKGVRWLSGLSRPEKLEDGSILWHGFICDITKRKLIDQQFSDIQRRWKFAVEGSGDGVWDWNIAAGKVIFSKRWYEIQGFEEGELGTDIETWESLVHPDDVPLVNTALQQHFSGETQNFACEHRVRCKNGHYKWILGRGMVTETDKAGKPLRIIGTHSDITERKLADVERTRLLKIIEEAPDFIATSDMDAHLQYLNPAGARMVGLAEDADLAGLAIEDFHPDWGARLVLEEGISTVLRQGYWQHENSLLHRDGREIPVSQLLLVHRDASGKPELLSTIMRDIAALKQIEADLKQFNENLERRVQEETEKNRQKEHLLIQQSRLAAMGEMIGNIAHQWRQPLNAVALVLGNLEDAFQRNELTREYLDALVRNGEQQVQKMSSTIDDFRNFFRPQKNPGPFSMVAAIEEARSLVYPSFRHHRIALQLESGEDIQIVGYPNEFSQVLLNILNNAKDAILARCPAEGRVSIRLSSDGTKARVVVTDNGGGIPESDLDQIFEPYFSTKEKGTGIGLYMSKMIVENSMGGSIGVRNVTGGAEFTVACPLDHETPPTGA